MVVYYTDSLEQLFRTLVICGEYVKPFWILFGPCFTSVKLSITALIACTLQWPWIARQSSALCETMVAFSKMHSACICVNNRPVWSIIYLTKSLKRNKYSLSHNIKKLTRKERISGDIATIMALRPNEWYRSTMYMTPSVPALYLVFVEQFPT